LDISEEDMDSIFKVNVYGVLFCMQAAAKYMMKQKSGRIINASSTSGIRGLEYLGHYAGTKFAVIGMTQSFAKELSSYGITVNADCTGLINTDMSTLIDEEIEKLTDRSMINQVGDPKDVANVVSFLASEKSKYISGQSLV